MLIGIQTFPKVALPPKALEIPSIPQLLDNSKQLQTRTSQPAVPLLYAESDYHWLVGVLDAFIEFTRRDKNHADSGKEKSREIGNRKKFPIFLQM